MIVNVNDWSDETNSDMWKFKLEGNEILYALHLNIAKFSIVIEFIKVALTSVSVGKQSSFAIVTFPNLPKYAMIAKRTHVRKSV